MGCILVVEDDASACEMLSLGLSDEGYVVRTVRDGAAALAAIEEHGPSLIVLDADTRPPTQDANAFIRAYRRRPGPHVPILALSANGPALSADRVLAKPPDLTELLGLVRRYTAGSPVHPLLESERGTDQTREGLRLPQELIILLVALLLLIFLLFVVIQVFLPAIFAGR